MWHSFLFLAHLNFQSLNISVHYPFITLKEFRILPDVGEEILSKYRNIQTISAGLMEDDQSHVDDDVFVKETEFDDDFKFEDAKRKLRIVLCMADRSNFPR